MAIAIEVEGISKRYQIGKLILYAPPKPPFVQLKRYDRAADRVRLDTPAGCLDFGQLWHRAYVCT